MIVQPSRALIDRYTEAGARFDADRIWRYLLWRTWEPERGDVLWQMLNPSTADESVLDPTLRRSEGFTRAWGFGGFSVGNLFPLRSTDQKVLRTHANPYGEPGVNADTIVNVASRAKLIVVGWGKETHPRVAAQARDVCRLLKDFDLWCLGTNSDGSPTHPLYLPAATPLRRYVRQ